MTGTAPDPGRRPGPLQIVTEHRRPSADQPATRRLWAVVPGATGHLGGPVALAGALFPYDFDGFDEDSARLLFAGEVPPDAVGYADTYPAPRGQLVVHEIYVITEYARRGIATALLHAAAGGADRVTRLRHRGLTEDGHALWAAAVGEPRTGYVTD